MTSDNQSILKLNQTSKLQSPVLNYPDQTFEKVIIDQVLERFDYNDAFKLLQESKRVLKKDGQIEIKVFNFQSWSVLWSWLFGRIDWRNKKAPSISTELMGDQANPGEETRSYWLANLLKLYLEKAGFKLKDPSVLKPHHRHWIEVTIENI